VNAHYLPIAVKNSGAALEEYLPEVLRAPITQKPYLTVCRLYRRLAVGWLLMSADPEQFFTYLFKSARAYVHFLEFGPDAEKVTSRSEPFFDAVACRAQDAARIIASKTPVTLNPKREYEEDFLYMRFLMELYTGDAKPAQLEDLLVRWAALAGDEDVRLALCRALLERKQKALDAAIHHAVEEKVQGVAALREEERLHPDEAPLFPHVSTEVLTWVELSGRVGLKTRRNLPLAPSVARLFKRARFPAPDSWRTPDSYREPWLKT
jgi:hypothetical protein